MTLARTLYEEAKDRMAPEEIIKRIIAERRAGSSSSTQGASSSPQTPSVFVTHSRSNSDDLSHRISMRFKDESKKVLWIYRSIFKDYESNYLQAARNYNLTPI